MNTVSKSVDAAVKPIESEHPNGEFEVILSTEARDRDGENLLSEEWKQPLPAKIHIDGDHGRNIEKTVGSAVPRIEGNRLVAKGTYAGTEYAQMVRQLVNEGHINSLSVHYGERKNQKGAGVQRELYNAAFVAVPANPEAVVLVSKSANIADKAEGGVDASGNNPQVKHDDMVQAIHDAAIHLGAQCMNEIEAQSGAADGANKSVNEETSSTKDAGSPQESPDDSPAKVVDKAAASAPAEATSEAAEDSAEAADIKAKHAAKARALAFLISKNIS